MGRTGWVGVPRMVVARLREINTLAADCIGQAVLDHASAFGRVSQLDVDIACWEQRLTDRPEVQLLRNARRELGFGIYNAASGLYLSAFGSLRLFLELSFASVYFSVHEVKRRRWMADREDFEWSKALDEREGVLAPDFVRDFYPKAMNEAPRYRAEAKSCYHECSQYLHGKIAATDTLPPSLAYSADVVAAWTTAAKRSAECVLFLLYCRYGDDLLGSDTDGALTTTLEFSFSHLRSVQQILGTHTEAGKDDGE